MLPGWGAERNHGSAGVYIRPVLGSSTAGRARDVAECDHTNTAWSEIAGPGVCSVYSRVENGRRTAADRSCTPERLRGMAVRRRVARCAAGRPAARRCPSPVARARRARPGRAAVALRVEAPRDQRERHPAEPGQRDDPRRQLVEVRDGSERGQRPQEHDRRGSEQGGPSRMPLPKPTVIGTLPTMAVIG